MVLERVKKVIHNHLNRPIEMILPASILVDDLGADSMDLVELIIKLQIEFQIDISDEEFEPITAVEGLVKLIEGKLQPVLSGRM